MTTYTITEKNEIEIDFHGIKPNEDIRNKMKAVRIWWDPERMLWHGPYNAETVAVAKEICNNGPIKNFTSVSKVTVAPKLSKKYNISKISKSSKDYALKVKIKDIISADEVQLELWEKELKDYVNEVMGEDNSSRSSNSVSKSQESAWMDCFKFIECTLSGLSAVAKEFELVFEYSLPGTVHERPDVFLLTDTKVISLEFKRKAAPQVDDNKDDVAQAIRYKEWLMNHHKVTIDKKIEVRSYLVCTHKDAKIGTLRGIDILTHDNFCDVLEQELNGELQCSFSEEWLSSSKTEMPDMLQAIEIMYREGRIPYISEVNKKCLKKVLSYIDCAKKRNKKFLILINGVPGAGKTAVGQSIVYEENKNGETNAVYLSGNGPLIEVLQYQINQVGNSDHMGENAIQGMKEFKSTFFYRNTKVPEQSILIFDEAQRAWDAKKLGKGFTEPEGLFRVGERIYEERDYAVLIGLYGNGQVIYTGEEAGLSLWEDALKEHDDWIVIASKDLADKIQGIGKRKIVDNDVFLPISLRADFIDCSKWVEQAICWTHANFQKAKAELEKLQKTSMRICVTRDFAKVQDRVAEIDADHPEWKYGMLVSNFAEKSIISKAMPGWKIGYKECNAVSMGSYGPWFTGGCKELTKACSVYGNQGLELDCPIVVFGGEYVRQSGKWLARGSRYDYDVRQNNYKDTDAIVENNYRVLLTRARKEMIILIPRDKTLDETYDYFVKMGMDEL